MIQKGLKQPLDLPFTFPHPPPQGLDPSTSLPLRGLRRAGRAATPANSSCRFSGGTGASKCLIISIFNLPRVLRDALKQYNITSRSPSAGKENEMLQQITIQTSDAKRLKPFIKSAFRIQLEDVEHGIQMTRERLANFEKQYNMSTTEFERRFHPGDLEETLEFIEWEGEIETLHLLEEKKNIIQTAHIK